MTSVSTFIIKTFQLEIFNLYKRTFDILSIDSLQSVCLKELFIYTKRFIQVFVWGKCGDMFVSQSENLKVSDLLSRGEIFSKMLILLKEYKYAWWGRKLSK